MHPVTTEHAINPQTQEVEAERPRVQDQPQVHNAFKAILGYKKPCLKNK